MRTTQWAAALLAGWMLAGCSSPEKPTVVTTPAKQPDPVRITQFYTSTPQVPHGEKGLICYGVENAKTVWLSPPKQELSASLARCVEVAPAAKTTYTLTAEGADGNTVTKELTLEAGRAAPPRVRIVNVNISAAEANPGDAVSICYKVENAQSVTVEPVHFRAVNNRDGCVVDQPRKTTTYVVRATGADGNTDIERVTIKVAAKP